MLRAPQFLFLRAALGGRRAALAEPMPMKGADGPSEDELKEIEDLKAMIHGTPQRESSIPLGAVSRFLVGEDNRNRAEEARKEKEERDRLKAEIASKRAAHGEKLRQEAAERRKREKEEKEGLTKQRQEAGRVMREKEAEWKAEAARRLQREWELGQKRVQEENERFKNMDKAEAAQDKAERAEGTRDRKAIEAAYKAEREAIMTANREQVQKVKKMTDPALIKESKEWAKDKLTGGAAQLKKQKEDLVAARQRVKESHLQKAAQIKGGVAEMKQRARDVQGHVLSEKKQHAAKERDNDYLVQQEKIRVLASKKQQHQSIYGKKFAPTNMAQNWTGASTLRRGAKLRGDLSPPEG